MADRGSDGSGVGPVTELDQAATVQVFDDDHAVAPQRSGVDVDAFTPRNPEQLFRLAKFVARSGLFKKDGSTNLSEHEACMIMLQGIQLGITPLQALTEVIVVKGKTQPSARLIAGLILRHPDLEQWDVESDAEHCTIVAKRRGRPETVYTRSIGDIPQHLLTPARSGEPSNYVKYAEDMIWAYCVRRLARRYFADWLIGLGELPDDRDVVDVRAVERQVGEQAWPCSTCGAPATLAPARNGGAFLRCANGHATSPPQAARDAMRGGRLVVDAETPTIDRLAPVTLDPSGAQTVRSPDPTPSLAGQDSIGVREDGASIPETPPETLRIEQADLEVASRTGVDVRVAARARLGDEDAIAEVAAHEPPPPEPRSMTPEIAAQAEELAVQARAEAERQQWAGQIIKSLVQLGAFAEVKRLLDDAGRPSDMDGRIWIKQQNVDTLLALAARVEEVQRTKEAQ